MYRELIHNDDAFEAILSAALLPDKIVGAAVKLNNTDQSREK